MEGTLRCTLESQAQHAHSLKDHAWSIQQSIFTHTKHFHNIEQQNSTQTHCKLFHQTHCELFHQTYCELFHQTFTNIVKHATHKTNRSINSATHKIEGYNITLTTTIQVQEVIKQIQNKNSQGPDKPNIRHLKHICPLGLAFLTSMFKTALNKNIIPHTWKLANIVPIPKPNNDTDKGTSYRLISLLSVIAKTLEKSLLSYITANIPNTPTKHGYKTQHSTVTVLHTVNNIVAKVFNQMAPPAWTITVAIDMSNDTIIKFIANYFKGRKAYTTYINHTSSQRQFNGRSSRWRPFTNTIQHLHCTHTTTQSTG